LPRGLYLVDAVPKDGVVPGQIVVACPPRSYAEIGRDHGYLIPVDVRRRRPGPQARCCARRRYSTVVISRDKVNGSQLPGTALLPLTTTAFRRRTLHSDISCARSEIWLFTPKPMDTTHVTSARADQQCVEHCKTAAHVVLAIVDAMTSALTYPRSSGERKVAPRALKSSSLS